MKKYILNADIIRVSALFAVVGIHLLNPIYARPDFFNGKFWWITFLLDCLFRASVPLFIILSGYLLLGKPTTIRENLHRTWNRIVVPLLSFYVIGYVYNALAAHFRDATFDYSVIFHGISKNSSSYLYFLVIIMFLYILIPLFQLVFEAKDKSLQKYLIIFFFANAVFATLARYLSLREGEVFNTYTSWILWTGYFLLGNWIRLNLTSLKKYNAKLLVVFAIGLLLTIVLGHWSWAQHWQGNNIFFIGGVTYPEEYLSGGVLLMSISGFILLMNSEYLTRLGKNPRVLTFLKWLASVSFGVYLVHPLVIDFLNKFCGVTADNPRMPNLVIYVLVNAVLTLTISIALSSFLAKMPVLRRMVGRTS